MQLSARNQLKGRIKEINTDGISSEIILISVGRGMLQHNHRFCKQASLKQETKPTLWLKQAQ